MGTTNEGFRFAPVTGRLACVTFIRDCTLTSARCMFVPYGNSRVTMENPSWELERM